MSKPCLYVIATPIGNLSDLSPRARSVLGEVDLVAAEDTRHSGELMRHFGISTPLVSLHSHNEAERSAELAEKLRAGASIALLSDAGTPGISDPGFDLVRRAASAGIEIIAVPGPCAAIAALSIAALPSDRFSFEGFLPARPGERRKRLRELANEPRTLIIYEAPHRLAESLADLADAFGAARQATIARELTKLHETVYRGTLGELAPRAMQDSNMARGEIVIVIAGAERTVDEESASAADDVLRNLLAELPLKQAARLAAKICGLRDNEAYRRALALRDK